MGRGDLLDVCRCVGRSIAKNRWTAGPGPVEEREFTPPEGAAVYVNAYRRFYCESRPLSGPRRCAGPSSPWPTRPRRRTRSSGRPSSWWGMGGREGEPRLRLNRVTASKRGHRLSVRQWWVFGWWHGRRSGPFRAGSSVLRHGTRGYGSINSPFMDDGQR